MKRLRLLWQSYYGMRIQIFILILILLIALFSLAFIIGLVHFQRYSVTVLDRSDLGDALYMKLPADIYGTA